MIKGMYVFCTTKFVGFHHWPEAPEKVKFLRNLHRHEFNVKASVETDHADRDVEFILLKRDVDNIITRMLKKWKLTVSCEMMAEDISTELQKKKYTVSSVEVSEDGENGAVVTYE